MDWTRISRLLNTPVDKLMARLKRHEGRLADWEKRMSEGTKELESLTVRLREAIARHKLLLERMRKADERAEAALRDGDEASARDILLEKQNWSKQLEDSRKETQVWVSAAKIAREKLARIRAEANEILASAGLPPIAEGSQPSLPETPEELPPEQRVRIKT